jgi:hypothetical protein
MAGAGFRVGLISNPASGHNRDRFERIRRRVDACSAIDHRISNSVDEVGALLEGFARERIDLLAINGGDGTVSAVLGTAMEQGAFATLPPVALLPGGTANMNAGDIGIRGGLERAVENFCAWVSDDARLSRYEERCLLRVSLAHEARDRYGMFLGGGAVITGTEYAHQHIHSRGLRDDLSLALGVVRTVWGVLRRDPLFSRAAQMQLCADEGPAVDYATLILAVSTLQRLAFGMRPFWGSGRGAARLTLIEADSERFLRTFLSIIAGRPTRFAQPGNGYHSVNFDRLRLSGEGALNLDGEIFAAKDEVLVSTTPAVRFLQLPC